jgi:hypothetical protein
MTNWTNQSKSSSSYANQSKNSSAFTNQQNLENQTSITYNNSAITYNQANIQYNGKQRPVWTNQGIS